MLFIGRQTLIKQTQIISRLLDKCKKINNPPPLTHIPVYKTKIDKNVCVIQAVSLHTMGCCSQVRINSVDHFVMKKFHKVIMLYCYTHVGIVKACCISVSLKVFKLWYGKLGQFSWILRPALTSSRTGIQKLFFSPAAIWLPRKITSIQTSYFFTALTRSSFNICH